MPRDSNLLKRNGLVLPGGLLAFYALLGIVYALAANPTDPRCSAAGQVVVGGAMCFNPVRWLVLFLLVGAALVALGMWRFQGQPETLQAQLRPGTGTHFSLALLASLLVLPLLLGLVRYAQAPGATMQVGTGVMAQWRVLLLAAFVGLLMFLPFLGLFLHQNHLRRTFLRHALEDEERDEEDVEPFARTPLEVPATQAAVAPEAYGEPEDAYGYPEDEPEAAPEAFHEPEPAAYAPPPATASETEGNPWAAGSPGRSAEEPEEEGPFSPGAGASGDEEDAPGLTEEEDLDGDGSEGSPPGLTEEEDLEGVGSADEAGLGAPLFGGGVTESEERSGLAPEASGDPSGDGDVDRRVDRVLEEHPEVAGVHYAAGETCAAHADDGDACGAPRRRDTKYCVEHGCHATTKAGEVCHNAAKSGERLCGVHAKSA